MRGVSEGAQGAAVSAGRTCRSGSLSCTKPGGVIAAAAAAASETQAPKANANAGENSPSAAARRMAAVGRDRLEGWRRKCVWAQAAGVQKRRPWDGSEALRVGFLWVRERHGLRGHVMSSRRRGTEGFTKGFTKGSVDKRESGWLLIVEKRRRTGVRVLPHCTRMRCLC